MARRILGEFVAAFRFLSRNPGAGHRRADLCGDRPVLFWPIRDYLILYRPGSEPLQILTIVRGSRDIPAIIDARNL